MKDNGVRLPGTGLALSGGGFRAILFHLGSLWKLNELGIFPKLSEISSVSGGSILGTYLGLKWKELEFTSQGVARNYQELSLIRCVVSSRERSMRGPSCRG